MEPKRDELGRLLPGHTANPNGRPKRKTFRDYFTEEEELDLINKIKQVSDKPEILKLTVEQLFGKPRQNIGIDGGEDGKELVITWKSSSITNQENGQKSSTMPPLAG